MIDGWETRLKNILPQYFNTLRASLEKNNFEKFDRIRHQERSFTRTKPNPRLTETIIFSLLRGNMCFFLSISTLLAYFVLFFGLPNLRSLNVLQIRRNFQRFDISRSYYKLPIISHHSQLKAPEVFHYGWVVRKLIIMTHFIMLCLIYIEENFLLITFL